jgi:hypothetical protein
MRLQGIPYMAGWDFINYWPNFLEGMSLEKHAWKQSAYYRDREEGTDGWRSPVVTWLQKYFHPYLVIDRGIHGQNGPGTDLSAWPEIHPVYREGEPVERSLVVFNDGLKGDLFTLRWEARWDSAEGEPVAYGVEEGIQIAPGFSGEVAIRFDAPGISYPERKLYLVLTSELEGQRVFIENEIFLTVTNSD